MLLAGRMAWISIAENEHYELLSESNRVNLTLVPPRRGWIVDRYGKPLANNKTDFRVDIISDRLHHKEATIASLANLLSLDPDEVYRVKADLDKAAGFQPFPGARKLDYAHNADVSGRLPALPGAAPTRGFSRSSPPVGAACNLNP